MPVCASTTRQLPRHDDCSSRDLAPSTTSYNAVLDLSGVNPPLVPLNPPSFHWPRENSQKWSKIHCWPPSGFTTNRVLVQRISFLRHHDGFASCAPQRIYINLDTWPSVIFILQEFILKPNSERYSRPNARVGRNKGIKLDIDWDIIGEMCPVQNINMLTNTRHFEENVHHCYHGYLYTHRGWELFFGGQYGTVQK